MTRTMRTLCFGASAVVLAVCGCSDKADSAVVGTLERDRIELVAEASEPIVEILVREGETIDAGRLILRQEGSRFEAMVARAEASLDRARARLAELERGPRSKLIDGARASLAAAEGFLVAEERELQRTRALVETGAESPQRLDENKARFELALGRRDRAKASLDALLEGTTSEEILQARASVAEAAAAVEEIRIQRRRLDVSAPQAGNVDALPYEVGERPPAGATVAVMLCGPHYARVYVPEPLRARVTSGTGASIRVDGLDERLAGRVRSVSHDPAFTPFFALTERDRRNLTYLAEVEIADAKARELPAGVPVEVIFDLDGGSLR